MFGLWSKGAKVNFFSSNTFTKSLVILSSFFGIFISFSGVLFTNFCSSFSFFFGDFGFSFSFLISLFLPERIGNEGLLISSFDSLLTPNSSAFELTWNWYPLLAEIKVGFALFSWGFSSPENWKLATLDIEGSNFFGSFFVSSFFGSSILISSFLVSSFLVSSFLISSFFGSTFFASSFFCCSFFFLIFFLLF